MALLGLILLIGIVKKNAIMMIDFALDAERRLGLSSHDAVYRACLKRFRGPRFESWLPPAANLQTRLSGTQSRDRDAGW